MATTRVGPYVRTRTASPCSPRRTHLNLMLRMNVLRKHLSKVLHILGAILGAWLFIRVLSSVGWKTVLASFQTHFQGLIVLTVCYFLYHTLRTVTLKICIPRKTHFRN